MKSLSNFLQKREKVSHPRKQEYDIKIMNMFVMAHAASSCLLNHLLVGVTLKPKSRGNYSGTPELTINIRKREAFATLI